MYIVFHSCRCQYACASVHREARTKLQETGRAVSGYFSTYYEDHIQPMKDSYAEWASGIRRATLDKIQTTIDNYMPKK